MAYVGKVYRWDLFWADLDPTVGSEQAGERRPVLVVSNDGFNSVYQVITVLPLTKLEGKSRKVYPFEVVLPASVVGNQHGSIVMPQQVRTIAKQRLLGVIGRLTDTALQDKIEDRLLDHLGIQYT